MTPSRPSQLTSSTRKSFTWGKHAVEVSRICAERGVSRTGNA